MCDETLHFVPACLCLLAALPLFAQMKSGREMEDFDAVFGLSAERPIKGLRITFVATNAPGCIFYPGEQPELTFQLGNTTAEPLQLTGKIEVIHFATVGMPGDIWKPLVVKLGDLDSLPVDLRLEPKGWQNVTLKPTIPESKGGYALVLDLGDQGRDFLIGVARSFRPVTERIQYPHQSLDEIDPAVLERLGIQAIRYGWGYTHSQHPTYPRRMAALADEMARMQQHKVTVVMEFGGGYYDRPIPPEVRSFLSDDGVLLGGKGDMVWMPKDDDDFEEYAYQIACQYGWPKGPITGYMLWNEPWEGRSISGWGADMLRYRAIYERLGKAAARARRDAGVDVLVGGCDSSTNSWDKLFPDGKDTFMPYYDFCSIHYQGMSAPVLYPEWNNRQEGKGRVLIWDTESWVANTDDRIAGVVATNRAAGYDRALGVFFGNLCTQLSHGRQQFDTIRTIEGDQRHLRPIHAWPAAAVVGAVQHFLGEREFRDILFTNGLPWVYVFDGLKENPDDGTIVVVGDIGELFTQPDRMLFRTVDPLHATLPTLTIDAADDTFSLYDFYGNQVPVVDGKIVVPLDARGYFFRARTDRPGSFAALVDAVRAARIDGFEPVELVARDFTAPIASRPGLRLTLTNILNRPVAGELTVAIPGLAFAPLPAMTLHPHETRELTLTMTNGAPTADNAYRLTARFDAGADGVTDLAEALRVNLIHRRAIVVDGQLDDWQGCLPQTIVAKGEETLTLTERAWLPFEKFAPGTAGGIATGYLAWDESHFYFAAKIADDSPSPGTVRFASRDDDAFFYPEVCYEIKADKYGIPVEKAEYRWAAGVRRYSYRRNPILPDGRYSRLDNVQIAFNAIPLEKDSWLTHLPGRMPKFVWYKCTDYEYALNTVAPEHGGGTEVWRLMVPGMPRKHFYPRQPKHPLEGAVTAAKLVTVHEGNTRITEVAIPWAELPDVKALLDAGQPVKFSFAVNSNQGGPIMELARDRSISRQNSQAFHVDWSEHWANELQFGWEK